MMSLDRCARVALLLLSLGACASSQGVRATSPAQPPVADTIDTSAETFVGTGKVDLFARSWRPRDRAVRGVVVIVHGLRDHGDRYSQWAQRLARDGFAVYAADLRGHGRSAGNRVWVDRFGDYVADLDIYVAKVRASERGVPLFLFGHSMGGTIVSRYVQTKQPEVAGVVLSAPALGFTQHPLIVAGLPFNGSWLLPVAPLLLLDDDDFSRTKSVVYDLGHDPLISHAGPARTGRELVVAVGKVWDDQARFRAPLLIVHGTGDKVTPPAASRDFVASVSSADRTLLLYDDFWHDLLHEPDSDRVDADVRAWLAARVTATAEAPKTAGEAAAAPITAPAEGAASTPVTVPTSTVTKGELRGDGIGMAGWFRGGLVVAQGIEDDVAVDAHARVALSFGRTVGWHVVVSGNTDYAEALPLGLSWRLGAGQIGLAAGIRGTSYAVPVEASLELPLGPVHGLASAEAAWGLDEDEATNVALGIDDIFVRAGVRVGRDRRAGRRSYVGGGPYLAGTYRRVGDENLLGVEIGVDLGGVR